MKEWPVREPRANDDPPPTQTTTAPRSDDVDGLGRDEEANPDEWANPDADSEPDLIDSACPDLIDYAKCQRVVRHLKTLARKRRLWAQLGRLPARIKTEGHHAAA